MWSDAVTRAETQMPCRTCSLGVMAGCACAGPQQTACVGTRVEILSGDLALEQRCVQVGVWVYAPRHHQLAFCIQHCGALRTLSQPQPLDWSVDQARAKLVASRQMLHAGLEFAVLLRQATAGVAEYRAMQLHGLSEEADQGLNRVASSIRREAFQANPSAGTHRETWCDSSDPAVLDQHIS